MVKRGPENPQVTQLVVFLEKTATKNKAPVWKAVAERLCMPRRKKPQVNLYELDKHCKDGETAVVPGKVLGIGNVSKKITVAAQSFSGSAAQKIVKAGGKAVAIKEAAEANPKGSGVRVIV